MLVFQKSTRMPGKDINEIRKNLPSTTIGGRMHTRSYARAVIEGVRKEELNAEKVAKKVTHQKKEKK